MARVKRFEEHRWVGDKRTQVVHDTDVDDVDCDVQEVVAAQASTCFGPDVLAEARNRGYRACRVCAPKPSWTDPSPT